jgi:hypothetical protein
MIIAFAVFFINEIDCQPLDEKIAYRDMILRTTERCPWQTAETGMVYSPKPGLVRTNIS